MDGQQDGKSQICFLAREDAQFPELTSNHNFFFFFLPVEIICIMVTPRFQLRIKVHSSRCLQTWQEQESSNPQTLQYH